MCLLAVRDFLKLGGLIQGHPQQKKEVSGTETKEFEGVPFPEAHCSRKQVQMGFEVAVWHYVLLPTSLVYQVLTLLKMNELQWSEAWEHAETAVQADNQLRVWWFNQTDGLLYECETGEVKLKHPIGKVILVGSNRQHNVN